MKFNPSLAYPQDDKGYYTDETGIVVGHSGRIILVLNDEGELYKARTHLPRPRIGYQVLLRVYAATDPSVIAWAVPKQWRVRKEGTRVKMAGVMMLNFASNPEP